MLSIVILVLNRLYEHKVSLVKDISNIKSYHLELISEVIGECRNEFISYYFMAFG